MSSANCRVATALNIKLFLCGTVYFCVCSWARELKQELVGEGLVTEKRQRSDEVMKRLGSNLIFCATVFYRLRVSRRSQDSFEVSGLVWQIIL